MSNLIKNVVIVGGGTAGWITAGLLAAEHANPDDQHAITITLIEDTDIAPIGVGEGTWPSMRETLKAMGIDEGEFIKQCDASFKQGSQFIDWLQPQSQYYHPFTLPEQFFHVNLAEHWLQFKDQVSFANAVTAQAALCDHHLAPKQITTPQYAFAANYGYHLDAGKFTTFLKNHCIKQLHVKHIIDNVVTAEQATNGDIHAVITQHHGAIKGDLFIDCSGLHGLLLDKVYHAPFISQQHILPNDSALAVQIPYSQHNPVIHSATLASAQTHGWIWDISLQSRKGIGHVYSRDFCTDEQAEHALRAYLTPLVGNHNANKATVRQLRFTPGHRAVFWQNNCVAVGLSAGFIEPLEASAIALIEQSAKFITKQLPRTAEVMPIVAKRFNAKFTAYWEQIIEFLKLHYVLSKRNDSEYWQALTDPNSIPLALQEKLALWQTRTPYNYDSTMTEELFPSASYQYIYYGMQGHTHIQQNNKIQREAKQAKTAFQNTAVKTQQLLNGLTSNQELLKKIHQFGLPTI